jgi:hypothetical protein
MTTSQIKKIEQMARQSASFAKKALQKSNDLNVLLSLLQHKEGKVKSYRSVPELFRTLKIS